MADGNKSRLERMMAEPPKMTVKTPPGIPPKDELEGWDELDRWACCNHALWQSIRSRTNWTDGMSELDKLRLLAGSMLHQNVALMQEQLKQEMESVVPRFTIPTVTHS